MLPACLPAYLPLSRFSELERDALMALVFEEVKASQDAGGPLAGCLFWSADIEVRHVGHRVNARGASRGRIMWGCPVFVAVREAAQLGGLLLDRGVWSNWSPYCHAPLSEAPLASPLDHRRNPLTAAPAPPPSRELTMQGVHALSGYNVFIDDASGEATRAEFEAARAAIGAGMEELTAEEVSAIVDGVEDERQLNSFRWAAALRAAAS